MKESRLWFWHLISGLALILLLGVHTVIQHFDSILTWLGFIPQAAWQSGGHLVGSLNFLLKKTVDVNYQSRNRSDNRYNSNYKTVYHICSKTANNKTGT